MTNYVGFMKNGCVPRDNVDFIFRICTFRGVAVNALIKVKIALLKDSDFKWCLKSLLYPWRFANALNGFIGSYDFFGNPHHFVYIFPTNSLKIIQNQIFPHVK